MPVIIIPERICKHCGGNKWYTYNGINKITYSCVLRVQETATKNYKENKKKYSETKANWAKNNREKTRLNNRKYYKSEKGKNYKRKQYKKYSENLETTYVKTVLSHHGNIQYKDITPELLDLKRKQLILYRTIKNNS